MFNAAGNPLGIEWVSADENRSQDFLNERNGAVLGLAAPDSGNIGLAEAGNSFISFDANQDVLANNVIAERADDGEFRPDATENRFGLHCGDPHGDTL